MTVVRAAVETVDPAGAVSAASARRPLAALDVLFRPRAVAVIGASSDPNKVGGRPIAFLKRAGWPGRILPVNPTAAEVQGLRAFRTLDEIDGDIDQAIVAVPAAQVLATAERCAARGVRVLQVFSAGFGDGPQAHDDQQRLQAIARAAGMRVLGPNSLGLFNAVDGFFGTFATALDGAWPQAGPVGVATQSGAFGSYFFGLAQQRGLGFSHFVATGNESDVDVADCIAWMAADPATRVIVTAIEGCRDGRKLAEALRAARDAGKPVFAMKVGVSQAGAQAAATHTGALAGEDRVFDAVFAQCGARRLGSLQALVDAALLASTGVQPAGRSLLVVTTSGGIGVLAADAAEADGLALPPVTDAAASDITAIAPLAGGRNPVDTSAGILGDLSAYARIAARAVEDGAFDTVLCYLAHIGRNPAHWAQLREPLFALRARHPQRCFVAVLLADAAVTADLQAHGFVVFGDPTRAVAAIAACAPVAAAADGLAARGLASATVTVAAIDGPVDDEHAATATLSARGIAFAPERFVALAAEASVTPADGRRAAACSADQIAAAQAAAREVGYPVVLKIVSPDIPHKTEAGGVQLGIGDDAALAAALPALLARVASRRPDACIAGVLVARQLTGGVELIVGTRRDPVFGPVITVGAGGVLAELLRDAAVRLAPVSVADAHAMLQSTRVNTLLDGWRGAPRCDRDALARQVATLSQIAWASRERVAGIDLNPVLATPDGAWALDALIVTEGDHR